MVYRFTSTLLAVCLFTASANAEELVYFRRDHGVASVDKIPLRFDESTLAWRVPVAHGHSTPVLVGDAIFLTVCDQHTNSHAVISIDRNTGEELWRQTVVTDRLEQQHPIGSPASSTVASDGQRIFAFFGSYGLLCYAIDGELLWSKPMGPFQDEFGSSSSPILVGEKLILNEDHDTDNFLTAIHRETGETVWTVARNEFTRSYSTPTIWEHDGEREIIVAGSTQLAAYDLETGNKLWWVNGLARIVNPTPVVDGDMIYVATWSPGGDVGERISMEAWEAAVTTYDQNGDDKIARDELQPGAVLTRFYRIDLDQDGALSQFEWERHASVFDRAENTTLALKAGGRGDVTATAVKWKNPTGAPYVCSPLLHDGVLWLVKDGGILTTLDATTGDVIKRGRLRGRGNYYSSPVLALGHVFIASQQGVLSVVAARGGWETFTSHDFGEGIYATPVFADDRMYLRTEAALYCFEN